MAIKTRKENNNHFDMITIKVASPDRIREWSHGEITKPETMNYRTQRSEKNGLFDEKIFGPDKDYECYCGKYRGIRYKGITCEKCGVEITRSIVRRERMGHIELTTPVSHIWFLKSMPSRIAAVLGVSNVDLEKVIYFAGYLVTKVNESEKEIFLRELDNEFKNKIKTVEDENSKEQIKELLLNARKDIENISMGRVLDEITYHKYSLKYGTLFEAHIGAEAVYNIFKQLDLKKLVANLEEALDKAGAAEKEKINKRLAVIKSLHEANLRPEWMFLTTLPVIPAGLRPMVALDGGRHATSDINDLYRRVINRNNRLRKLKDIHAPDVILRNEKRILQEAIDALIDNSIRHGNALISGVGQAQRRPLKSISDNLKGKRGLFRQNLLGKRVDYSGRSVIVVGPSLALNQCGLPKHMALELFRPFVISKLLERELAYNIRGASRLIDEGIPEVWAILEEVIAGKYVLLNRAPTLHRLGIQAFQPKLIEGNAIQVHPMVCTAFNADFDGDMMAVHIPLSEEAQLEAKEIMAADKNILKPGSGDPVVIGKLLDIILGCYWMTKTVANQKGDGKIFSGPTEAITAHSFGEISYQASIKVLVPSTEKFAAFEGKIIETTLGRILFNELLPDFYPFVNKEIDKKTISQIVDDLMVKLGTDALPPILDKIKHFGFTYATTSGITWSMDDIIIPEGKKKIIEDGKIRSEEVVSEFNEGLLSEDERIRKNIEIWHGVKNDVEKLIPETVKKSTSIHDMIKSGARGSLSQITQMAGMKGLIQNTAGETIEFPILSCSKTGLTPIEYFITTHGSRKGLTDTALNTAKAGYLTRRLFDVAQDVIITEIDCGIKEGITVKKETASGIETPISKNIKGRVLSKDLLQKNGEILFKRNHLLSNKDALVVEAEGIEEVSVRSPLTCKLIQGICQMCYGLDLGKNKPIDLGEAVGTVAAQAIGEPGTQLTMRTFHAGGTASVGGDITQGLPRVEEVFEKRKPKVPAIVSHTDGMVTEIRKEGKEHIIVVIPDIAEKTKSKKEGIEYEVSHVRMMYVKVGDTVKKGQLLTDGSADIDELFKYAGKDIAQEYIISEIKKLYELQGEPVSRKHIEVIVRQMFGRVKVKNPGETKLVEGDIVESKEFVEANDIAKAEGKEEAKCELIVMGITDVSLTRESFLSSASFQHTTRVLISAAIKGSVDLLKGLKENVIIGRLIPAGSGFKGSMKANMVEQIAIKRNEEYTRRQQEFDQTAS